MGGTNRSEELPLREIAEVFHDVQGTEESLGTRFVLERWLHDPPSYIVRLTLGAAGFKVYRGGDKSVWGVNLRYEGITFSIADWKRESWEIGSAECGDRVRAAGQRLKKKISQAAKRVDAILRELGKSKVERGEFFVNNTYPKVRGAYEHFRGAMEHAADANEGMGERGPDFAKALEQQLNEEFHRRSAIAYNGYAAIGFYFASLEVLFDVLFAVGPQTGGYREFRNRSWAERFQVVLPSAIDPDLAKLYQELKQIKMDIRDVLFHGTGDTESLLVALPRMVGLVPVSYQGATDSVLFNAMVMMDSELLSKAVRTTFDDFDAWLELNPPYSYAVEFANHGLAIPFHGRALERIRAAMADPGDFQELIEDEMRAYDYFLNDFSA